MPAIFKCAHLLKALIYVIVIHVVFGSSAAVGAPAIGYAASERPVTFEEEAARLLPDLFATSLSDIPGKADCYKGCAGAAVLGFIQCRAGGGGAATCAQDAGAAASGCGLICTATLALGLPCSTSAAP